MFCKYDTHAKCLHGFQTLAYSRPCHFREAPPTESSCRTWSRNAQCSNATAIDCIIQWNGSVPDTLGPREMCWLASSPHFRGRIMSCIRERGSVLYLGMAKDFTILIHQQENSQRSYYPPNQACRQNDTA